MEQYIVNKSIVRDFYGRAVGQGDLAFAEQIVADDYIQHSPMAKAGKASLMETLQYLKRLPKPENPAKPFMRLIAEGDYVATNLRFAWGGKQKVVVDLFRLQDGEVAEHWDAVQDQPENTLNGQAMMDGPVEIEDAGLTQANKEVVEMFYQRVFVERQLEALSDFVGRDLIQHHPDVRNGIAGLEEYFQRSGQFSIEKVHRVIGEGNFAVVQSEGQLDGKPCVCYDVFRLSEGKIAEQWSVRQAIPENIPHSNGVI